MKSVYANTVYWIGVFDRMWRTAVEFGVAFLIAVFSDAIIEQRPAVIDVITILQWMLIGGVLSFIMSFLFPKKVAGIIKSTDPDDGQFVVRKKHRM